MQKSGQGFNMRSFTSLLVSFSGLAMILSGLVLYIMPEGRVAYWADWRLTGLGKEQWGTMHTCLSLVFFVFAILHLYYNWRTFLSYLKDRIKQSFTLRKELVAALLISALCLHGSIVGYAPFTSVMDLGKKIKKTWYAGQDVHPPFPHAELMQFKQLARKIDFNLEGALEHLREKGLQANSGSVTLKELAADSPYSPAEIFEGMMMDDRLYQ